MYIYIYVFDTIQTGAGHPEDGFAGNGCEGTDHISCEEPSSGFIYITKSFVCRDPECI